MHESDFSPLFTDACGALQTLQSEAHKPDMLVLGPVTTILHASVAELLGLPFCTSAYYPNAVTSDHGPAVGFPGGSRGDSISVFGISLAKTKWGLAEKFWWSAVYHSCINPFRKSVALSPIKSACGNWEFIHAGKCTLSVDPACRAQKTLRV